MKRAQRNSRASYFASQLFTANTYRNIAFPWVWKCPERYATSNMYQKLRFQKPCVNLDKLRGRSRKRRAGRKETRCALNISVQLVTALPTRESGGKLNQPLEQKQKVTLAIASLANL